jgi:hypothetical protein
MAKSNPVRDDNDEKYRMKEKEKMLAGEVYSAVDPELIRSWLRRGR